MTQPIKLIEVLLDHGSEFEALLNDLEMKHKLNMGAYILKIRHYSQNKPYLKLKEICQAITVKKDQITELCLA